MSVYSSCIENLTVKEFKQFKSDILNNKTKLINLVEQHLCQMDIGEYRLTFKTKNDVLDLIEEINSV